MLLHSSSKQTYVITFPYKRGPSSIYAGMNCAAPAGVTPEAGPSGLTGDGDHLYISGSPAAATTSAPAATTTPAPSGLPAVAITPGCAPSQGGPRPCPHAGGDNEAIKAKESGTRRQGGFDGPASGGNHLCSG
jgi:hypothetical protein